MFKNIANYFEDSDYATLGTVVKFLKLTFIWRLSRTRIQNFIYFFILSFATAITFNQLVYLIVMRKAFMFMTFVQYSIYPMGWVKILSYHIWHKKWETIIDGLSKIEKELDEDANCKELCKNNKKWGKTLIIAFWTTAVVANITLMVKNCFCTVKEIINDVPSPMRTKIFYIWWPFSEESRPGWILDVCLQNFYAEICSTYVVAWDSLLVLIMVVFAGHLKLVALKFKHTFDAGTLGEQRNRIIKCHQTYLTILKLHEICNSVITPLLFLHIFIVTVNIAVSISNMNLDNPELFFSALVFMGGLLYQLVLIYWFGNEVTVQSELVSYSVFESDWIGKDLDTKRLIALISLSTTKRLYFTAGPFSRVSLSTFVAILRASYSFYTLMKETANK